ncbi:unnamed protein product, partial [marine sediment metagenome]
AMYVQSDSLANIANQTTQINTLEDIETVLNNIKDIDGIKKIIDHVDVDLYDASGIGLTSTTVGVKQGLDVSLISGDVAIGAVEIKDGDSDTRVDVEADPSGTHNAMFVQSDSLATQEKQDEIDSRIHGSDNNYYQDQDLTALTAAFVQQLFGFTSTAIAILDDDASGYIEWSFDGATVHGKLFDGESITMDKTKHSSIYLRGEAGGEDYRVIVW